MDPERGGNSLPERLKLIGGLLFLAPFVGIPTYLGWHFARLGFAELRGSLSLDGYLGVVGGGVFLIFGVCVAALVWWASATPDPSRPGTARGFDPGAARSYSDGSTALVCLGGSVLYNLVFAPLVARAPQELLRGQWEALFGIAAGVVGGFCLWRSVRIGWHWWRFGTVRLLLDPFAPTVGQTLSATLSFGPRARFPRGLCAELVSGETTHARAEARAENVTRGHPGPMVTLPLEPDEVPALACHGLWQVVLREPGGSRAIARFCFSMEPEKGLR